MLLFMKCDFQKDLVHDLSSYWCPRSAIIRWYILCWRCLFLRTQNTKFWGFYYQIGRQKKNWPANLIRDVLIMLHEHINAVSWVSCYSMQGLNTWVVFSNAGKKGMHVHPSSKVFVPPKVAEDVFPHRWHHSVESEVPDTFSSSMFWMVPSGEWGIGCLLFVAALDASWPQRTHPHPRRHSCPARRIVTGSSWSPGWRGLHQESPIVHQDVQES